MDRVAILDLLQKEYYAAGFSEVPDAENLVFSKSYGFTDAGGQEKSVTLIVIYWKKAPILPPELLDPERVLSSMHSLNGFQCWARFSDIFQQAGLGVIGPDVIEKQIGKLINAHVTR